MLLEPTNDWPGEILAISTDGKVVTGTHANDGFYWSEADGMKTLGGISGQPEMQAAYPNAIAQDGALIFGAYGDPWQTIPIAFVWTAADGMRSLQDVATAAGITIPEGVSLANVMAASTDGSVLLGWAYDGEGATVSFMLRLPVSAYGL